MLACLILRGSRILWLSLSWSKVSHKSRRHSFSLAPSLTSSLSAPSWLTPEPPPLRHFWLTCRWSTERVSMVSPSSSISIQKWASLPLLTTSERKPSSFSLITRRRSWKRGICATSKTFCSRISSSIYTASQTCRWILPCLNSRLNKPPARRRKCLPWTIAWQYSVITWTRYRGRELYSCLRSATT